MADKAGVILITYDFLHLTQACLDSFMKNTSYPNKLLIIENGSTDGTPEYLRTTPYQVVYNAENLRLSVALNQGIKHFLDDPEVGYIVMIHPDMVFFEGWLTNLIHCLNTVPKAGKVSSYNPPGPLENYTAEAVAGLVARNAGKTVPGNSAPWAKPVNVVREVGLFDEEYLGCGGYDDWDYNNRLLEKGYRVLIAGDSLVWHEGAATRKQTGKVEDSWKNAERYTRKWGPGARV